MGLSIRITRVIELIEDGELAGRALDDLERIGRRQHPRQPVRHAKPPGVVRDRAVLQAGHVPLVGGLAGLVERQIATADELDFRAIPGCPVDAVGIGAVGRTARLDAEREQNRQRRCDTDRGK
jgi:hypothetical protein